MSLETRLKPTWDWILTVMDATEAQLRFGASLANSTDSSHPLHPLHLSAAPTSSVPSSTLGSLNVLGSAPPARSLIDPITTSHNGATRIVGFSSNSDSQRNFDRENYAQISRREFLTYALSLMRSHSSEHRDSLPVLDVTALRHIAYVLDGMLFYMRSAKENETEKNDTNYWLEADENENDDTEDELQMNCDNDSIDEDALPLTNGVRHTFFQRSESTLCLGCPPPDPFNTPMSEALPLADQPHLLQPNACREDLFGIPKQPITLPSNNIDPPGLNSPLELPPTRLGLSSSPKNATNTTALAHLANQYGSQYSYGESSNDTHVADDHPMSLAIEEPKENVELKTDVLNTSGVPTAITPKRESIPGPSKENNSTWRQPEGFNLYVQLKKKTYIDFDDSKNNSDAGKRTDIATEDLSIPKLNNENTITKMELDSDHEDLTDSESDGRSLLTPDINIEDNQSCTNQTIRPQIIVKTPPTNETVKPKALVKNDKAETSFSVFVPGTAGPSTSSGSVCIDTGGLSVIAQSGSNSNSPSKSVIVRVGPSVSLKINYFSLKWVLDTGMTLNALTIPH